MPRNEELRWNKRTGYKGRTAFIEVPGSIGFEVAYTRTNGRTKFFVSARDPYFNWWHSHSEYTEVQAEAIYKFLSSLSPQALQEVIWSKSHESTLIETER